MITILIEIFKSLPDRSLHLHVPFLFLCSLVFIQWTCESHVHGYNTLYLGLHSNHNYYNNNCSILKRELWTVQIAYPFHNTYYSIQGYDSEIVNYLFGSCPERYGCTVNCYVWILSETLWVHHRRLILWTMITVIAYPTI